MRKNLRAFALMLAAALAAGCGGASTGIVPSQPASPQPSQAKTASVAFRIVIPAAPTASGARRPAYVSASTQSASITVASNGGIAGSRAVVNCTNVCSGTVNAPAGNDTFTVNLYDAQNGGGNVLSSGTTAQSIVLGQANTVNVTFNGVVASLALSLNPANITPGSAGTVGVAVNALDADGNVIVGPGIYVDQHGGPVIVALSDSDPSGASQLSQTTITQPTTGITLSYTAALTASTTITASASGFTSAAKTLSTLPELASLSASSGLIGTSVTETLTGTSFAAGSIVKVSGSLVSVSNVTVNSPASITATFFIDPQATIGARNVTVTTPGGTSPAQTFTVSNAGVDVVTLNSDALAGSPSGSGAGNPGELRYVMQHASSGDTIVFDTTTMCASSTCTISLSGPLPPIVQNLTIDAGNFGRVTIDGANGYRAFWVESGNVTLANLQIQNVLARGGSGGFSTSQLGGGGGGGAGLGAGLFVNSTSAQVRVVNDYFVNAWAYGGIGGFAPTCCVPGGGGNGGGGLSGLGGIAVGQGGGGGGGGVLGYGGTNYASSGGMGGLGGGGGGGGGSMLASGSGGAGGVGYAGDAAGTDGANATFGRQSTGGAGGNGGIGGGGGGGGGGAGSGDASGGTGGLFAGGGGSGWLGWLGGPGGPGGGGGGTEFTGSFAPGGPLGAIAGGTGDDTNHGGGGAAAGPAIFVNGGSLSTTNSSASGSIAVGGGAGGGSATNGGSDSTPVFNYNGSVNGSATKGPVAGALGMAIP